MSIFYNEEEVEESESNTKPLHHASIRIHRPKHEALTMACLSARAPGMEKLLF